MIQTLSLKDAAHTSIGSIMTAKSLELKHTIKLIRKLNNEIDEVDAEIKKIIDNIASPITISGIGYSIRAMII